MVRRAQVENQSRLNLVIKVLLHGELEIVDVETVM
jgi:hypothetical protein